VVEDLLGDQGDAARVALDFLEDLQNVAPQRIEGLFTPEDLLPLRGWHERHTAALADPPGDRPGPTSAG
jgi:hypothetical protein